MNELNREIGQRIAGLRELTETSRADFAKSIRITQAELSAYEAGEKDIPVSVLHEVSQQYGVSTTELMTGQAARLHQYCVVRSGKGIAVDRREAYGYRSLAYNFVSRQMEPMYITIPASDPAQPYALNTHGGQEFHYCLEGGFTIRIAGHEVQLEQGDSIYFDSSSPHGMKSPGGAKCLVIITM